MNLHIQKKLTLLVLGMMLTAVSACAQGKDGRIASKGLAVMVERGNFETYEFTRRAIGSQDILIETLYAGICHSDLHYVRGDWGARKYPMVPGHEIVGRVVQVGKNVTRFKVGDYAGIGCMVGSCRKCDACTHHHEQYCQEGPIMTYEDTDRYHNNDHTQGGYSNNYVVDQYFAIRIPANADISKVAPLLCAGITTYSPIHFVEVKSGDKIGIAGFGGLGHMGLQYAVALGAEVTVFDITEDKRQDAQRMGAHRYVNVTKPADMQGLNNSFDFILSTIPVRYDLGMYLQMLHYGGQLGIVGYPAIKDMPSISVAQMIGIGNRKIFGSLIGGIKETQEMLDYSVKHNIYPQIEIIQADGKAVDRAYQNVLDGKVKFRYVIDMKTLK